MATKTVIGKKSEIREAQTGTASSKPKKGCVFCEMDISPSYTDTMMLRKFLSDRAKIISRTRTGVCSKHQRAVAREIKHARHLALLPFIARV